MFLKEIDPKLVKRAKRFRDPQHLIDFAAEYDIEVSLEQAQKFIDLVKDHATDEELDAMDGIPDGFFIWAKHKIQYFEKAYDVKYVFAIGQAVTLPDNFGNHTGMVTAIDVKFIPGKGYQDMYCVQEGVAQNWYDRHAMML